MVMLGASLRRTICKEQDQGENGICKETLRDEIGVNDSFCSDHSPGRWGNNRDLWDVLDKGTSVRTQPLTYEAILRQPLIQCPSAGSPPVGNATQRDSDVRDPHVTRFGSKPFSDYFRLPTILGPFDPFRRG
jgi:hypothetical protein